MLAKGRPIIAARDVPKVFSDECVRALAVEAKLPLSDDALPRFATSIRAGAHVYIRDTNTLSDDDICREIEALHRAADLGDGAKAANLVQGLSKQTRAFINKRAIRIGSNIPKPSAFRDPARRRAACDRLRALLSQGGHSEEGKWVPHLYLPRRQLIYEQDVQQTIQRWLKAAHSRGVKIGVNITLSELRRKAVRSVRGVQPVLRPPKRKAERDFIMFLQVDYLNATGREPPVTARKSGTGSAAVVPGPFARFAKLCLDLLGASNADATGLINKLQERRKSASHGQRQKPNK